MDRMAHRVAERFVGAAVVTDLLPIMDEVVKLHETALQPWVARFSHVLTVAQQDAGDLSAGWVWQDRFVPFLSHWDDTLNPQLEALDDRFEQVWLQTSYHDAAVKVARQGSAEPTGHGRISYAISNITFKPHAELGDHLAYNVDTLQEWATAFEAWSHKSVREIGAMKREVRCRTRVWSTSS